MNLKRLKYFLAVAEHRHFGKAAETLHISQPPLSQHISALEKELGFALFVRTTRRVQLTEAGTALFNRLKKAIGDLEDAVSHAQLVSRGEGGTLRLAFVSTSTDMLSKVLLEFRNRYPNTDIKCLQLGSLEQASALKEGTIDAGLLRRVPIDPETEWCVVRQERLYVAMAAQHPLHRRRRIRVTALAREKFVIWEPEQTGGMTPMVLSLCAKYGFEPNVAVQVKNTQPLLSLVAGGLGIAIVPESTLQIKQDGLVYRPLDASDTHAELVLAWRRDSKPELVRSLIAVVRKVGKSSAALA